MSTYPRPLPPPSVQQFNCNNFSIKIKSDFLCSPFNAPSPSELETETVIIFCMSLSGSLSLIITVNKFLPD